MILSLIINACLQNAAAQSSDDGAGGLTQQKDNIINAGTILKIENLGIND